VPRCKYEDDAYRCVKQWEKRAERAKAGHYVMKNRQQLEMFFVLIHVIQPHSS
jgi:hypothetical protein